MKRKAILYRSSELYKTRHFYIDEQNANEILELFEQPKIGEKIEYILGRILEQRHIYFELYEKIGEGISEMRIFPNGINARIYCKEVKSKNGNFFIIAAKGLPKKKGEKIDKSIKQIIDPIKNYDYDL